MEDKLCVWRLAWQFVAKSSLHHGVFVCWFGYQWRSLVSTSSCGGSLSNYFCETDGLCHSDITFGVCFGVWSVLFLHRCVFCGWLLAFRIVWIVVFFLLVVSDCFSQRHGDSMSMRSCQRRGVGFPPRYSVLMWCWLAHDGLFTVVYLRKRWKFLFSMYFPNRWFACIMWTCMLMCVFYCRVRASFSRHGVRPCADGCWRREDSLWPSSFVMLCFLCITRNMSNGLVFVPRVHRFPEHMVSMFSSGLDDEPFHSARLRLLPREA